MNITTDNMNAKSFLDLLGGNAQTQNEKFSGYADFRRKLLSDLMDTERREISRYWSEQEESTENGEVLMRWVDEDALEQAKRQILQHPEKRGTKAFSNLVLRKKTLNPKFDIFDELDKELPNFKKVTEFYRGSFALNQSRDATHFQSPRPVLLLGNPGIGKTHYAKKLAKLLGTYYRFFDANSISMGAVLSGQNASWKGADAGLIFREMAKSETISPIFLFDEIDKIKSERQHSPFSVFHQLFEKENAKTFCDEFVDLEFDASQIIYILTANDASNIEDSLLSRMQVFHIENPDEQAMREIVQNIYQTTLAGSKLFAEKLAEKELVKLLKLTPREATQVIANSVFAQASRNIGKTEMKLSVDYEKKTEKRSIGFTV